MIVTQYLWKMQLNLLINYYVFKELTCHTKKITLELKCKKICQICQLRVITAKSESKSRFLQLAQSCQCWHQRFLQKAEH